VRWVAAKSAAVHSVATPNSATWRRDVDPSLGALDAVLKVDERADVLGDDMGGLETQAANK
jgi:hypothetical protein